MPMPPPIPPQTILQLHIHPPAFSLPSIDAECLAAVAYLGRVVPRGGWVVVADGSVGEIMSESERQGLTVRKGEVMAVGTGVIRNLPALRDGNVVVEGFKGIVEYLRGRKAEWDLDGSLMEMQKADGTAFSALLTAHALPLLDLSLYVSSENYSTATRPAYASLLPFPASWIIPTKRRTLAKQRSAHLGLSSLDLDTASPSDTATPPSASFLQIPKSLRTPKTSVAAAVKSPETASRIRLEVLAQTVLDPLAALLDERPHDERVGAKDSHGAYFFSATAPCSLDCLVLGYLALFLVPDIPHPFLATTLKKYPALTTYVRRGIQKFFFFPTHVPAPESLALGNNDLSSSTSTSKANVVGTEHPGSDPVGFPWRDPLPPSALSGVGLVLHESAASIPLLGPLLQNGSIRHASTSATATANNQPTSETVYLKTFVPAIGALWVGVTAVAAVVGAVMLSEKASVGHDQGWGGGWGHAGGDRVVGSAEAGTRGLSEMGDTGDALLAGLWVGRAARERGGQRQMPAGEGGEVEV